MKDVKPRLPYLSRNTDWQSALKADEVEFRAVMMRAASLDEGTREERWSGEIEEELPGARPAWIEREDALERIESSSASEIERRALLLGDGYPFALQGSRLSYRPSRTGVYEFCLAVSLAPSLSAREWKGLPVAFEFLSRDVLCMHLGPETQGVRTGWPRDSSEGLPTRAKKLFAHLRERTGEWVWRPRGEDRPEDPSPTYEKDMGLDVVVWRAMPDGRIGQLFLLGQCACGKSDWEQKFKDLDLEELGLWLSPPTHCLPVRCFFVPFHIGNAVKLEEVSLKAGVPFDRARIVLIAESNPGCVTKQKTKLYRQWVEKVADSRMTLRTSRRRSRRS